MGLGALVSPFGSMTLVEGLAGFNPRIDADQDFSWEKVREAFEPSPEFINLENGYFSPQTADNYDAFASVGKRINQNTSQMMRGELKEEEELTRNALAEFCQVDGEELVITRNTTESLNIVINGLDLEPGDEAIINDQDYPNMINAFRQREKRDGLVIKEIKIPLDPKSDEEIVKAYDEAITSKTRVILVTHMINLTGQLLPCRKIADMAHSKGVEVIVDAAHSFAHIDFNISELGADYLGTSLHKWLSAPVGCGLLYIKKDKISKVWPLMGDAENDVSNIRKFQRQGTLPMGTRKGIRDAIEFHNYIGSERKEERLRSFTQYWTDQVRRMNKFVVNTPENPLRYGALGNFNRKGLDAPGEISRMLFKDYKIMTVPIRTPSVTGIRVTPHLYNTTENLDKFLFALRKV